MDEFCGSTFWNSSLTWYTNNPDFTKCFQNTILIWTPCLVLWFFLPLEIYQIFFNCKSHLPSKSWKYYTKIVINIILIILCCIDLIRIVISNQPNYSYIYVSLIIKSITFTLSIYLVVLNARIGRSSSGVLFFFWFLFFIFESIRFRSHLIQPSRNPYTTIMSTISYIFLTCMLLLNFSSDTKPDKKQKRECPEDNSSFVSKTLIIWIDKLIWKGYRNHLEVEDLWNLPTDLTCGEIIPKFEKEWQKSSKWRNEQQKRNNQVAEIPNISVLGPLWRIVKNNFLWALAAKLAQDTLLTFQIKLFERIIHFHEYKEESWKGIFYVIILITISISQTILSSFHNKAVIIMSVKISTALTSAIYQKSLKLNSVSRNKSSIGEIVNLMTIDTQRFREIIWFITLFFTIPYNFILITFWIWLQLGPASLCIIVVFFIFFLLHYLIYRVLYNLQLEEMSFKDKRVHLLHDLLSGIKVLKLYVWESHLEEVILKIRSIEERILYKIICYSSFLNQCGLIIPFIVSIIIFSVYLYTSASHSMNVSQAFVSVFYCHTLYHPLSQYTILFGLVIQCLNSLSRINSFLNLNELPNKRISRPNQPSHQKEAIVVENGSFTWEDDASPILDNINLTVDKGQLIALLGSSGNGKSSLFSALLGEMTTISGRIHISGSVAYVAQRAWIQNGTIRDNILFGKRYEEYMYFTVMEISALAQDLAILPEGDLTKVGDNGVNLSGGQKQRISLARALYQNADIYYLDDPLSALDPTVAKHIFNKVIGPTGFLKNKTRILVTHKLNFLEKVDRIILINENGNLEDSISSKESKSLQQILNQNTTNNDIHQTESEANRMQVNTFHLSNEEVKRSFKRRKSSLLFSMKMPRIISNDSENSFSGNVKWTTYLHFVKILGLPIIISIFFLYFLYITLHTGLNLWLYNWSSSNVTSINDHNYYIKIYAVIGICQVFVLIPAYIISSFSMVKGSTYLHKKMLRPILNRPLRFYDTTPIGRILNRFSYDVNVLDNLISLYFRTSLQSGFMILVTITILSYYFVKFLLPTLLIGIAFFLLNNYFAATYCQLKRLESLKRSPLYSFFSETLTGIFTIRAFNDQKRFTKEFEEKLDSLHRCHFYYYLALRWFLIRLDTLANIFLLSACLFLVLNRNANDTSISVPLIYLNMIVLQFNQFIRSSSNFNSHFVSVERIREYAEKQEKSPLFDNTITPPKNWPSDGKIEFRNVFLQYIKNSNCSLQNINIIINGGEKIGIVGRTGAGKSTIVLSLFRMVELHKGSIIIDGIDISKLDLQQLRSNLTIIPQDVVVFSGSIRMNLDPLNLYNDEEIWYALEQSHLRPVVQSLPGGLDFEITNSGILSDGERQLLCLARALLKKPKILILDEATAFIDIETEEIIQSTIKREFKRATIICIAHRIEMLMGFDRILVIDNGQMKEFDKPKVLIQNKQSVFYEMAKDAGML